MRAYVRMCANMYKPTTLPKCRISSCSSGEGANTDPGVPALRDAGVAHPIDEPLQPVQLGLARALQVVRVRLRAVVSGVTGLPNLLYTGMYNEEVWSSAACLCLLLLRWCWWSSTRAKQTRAVRSPPSPLLS